VTSTKTRLSKFVPFKPNEPKPINFGVPIPYNSFSELNEAYSDASSETQANINALHNMQRSLFQPQDEEKFTFKPVKKTGTRRKNRTRRTTRRRN